MVRVPEPPDDVQVARAAALLDLGRAEQARALLGPVLASDPDHVEGWCLLAQAHLDSGDAGSALQAATSARALAPDDTWGYRLGSQALTALGRHADAVHAAEQALEREPGAWVNHAMLALACNAEPQRHLAAWHHATEAVRIEPTEPGPHLVVGIVAQTSRHLDQARQAYSTVILLDPTNGVARHNLALLDLGRGRVRDAASGLREAVLADPADAMARANAARVVDVLLGRLSWVVVGLLFLSAAVVGRSGPAPGLSLVSPLFMVSATVFVVGRVRLIDRQGLVRLARAEPRLRVWAGCLGAAAVLTCLVGVSGSAVPAVVALLLLLVGPFWTMQHRLD